jgi:hypothetical protein
METLETYKAIVTTNCQCNFLDEEGNEYIPNDCHGCGDDMLWEAQTLLEQFLERRNYPNAVIIHGSRMGWRNLSGYAIVQHGQNYWRDILDKLTLNGDFTLEMELNGDILTVARYSHDEPMGASFTIEPVTVCQGWSGCEAIDELQDIDGVPFCKWCAEIEEANR